MEHPVLTEVNLWEKSVLHYYLNLTKSPHLDFIRLINYLTLKDIGYLDTALSEYSIRYLFLDLLKVLFSKRQIIIGNKLYYFEWIISRDLCQYIECLTITSNYKYKLERNTIIFANNTYSFPALKVLQSQCMNIHLFNTISLNSHNIHSVSLSGSEHITDNIIDLICTNCPLLSTLILCAFCSQHTGYSLTDRALESIAVNCPMNLKVLHLYYWKAITNNGILLLQSLINIHELVMELPSNWNISDTTIITILSKYT